MLSDLNKVFETSLQQLKTEIESYPDESLLWKLVEGTANSGGNLCLHLCGNLQHFIGRTLGKTNYQRNRNAEFNDKDVPREQLISEIGSTINSIRKTLESMDPVRLKEPYPIQIRNFSMNVQHMLFHLLNHLGYHLGQINYHRRMVAAGENM